MPKTKFDKYANPAPPVDWLWACILERKAVFGYDLKQMAKIAGVHYDTMRRYIRKSPWEWSPDARARVCKAFGISTKITVGRYDTPDEMKGRRERA